MYRYVHQAHQVDTREAGGRRLTLVESRHKSSTTGRAIAVRGGPNTPRLGEGSYRSAEPKTFAIDPIVIRLETKLDRFGKRLGLNAEASLGDAEFDDRYYIETETRPEVVRELVGDAALLATIKDALGAVQAVVIGHPAGEVAGVQLTRPKTLDLENAAAVAKLEAVAKALPVLHARLPKSALALTLPRIAPITLFDVFLVAGILLTLSSRYLDMPMILLPLAGGALTGLVLAFTVCRWFFRGRPNGVVPWLGATLFGIVGMAAFAIGVANQANFRLDESKPEHYVAEVLEYRRKVGKKDGVLRVRGLPSALVALRGGSQELPTRLMPNPNCKRISLRVGAGKLGNPWVSEATCSSP